MSSFHLYMKKCPRGHPVDGPVCGYCEQEKKDQDEKDDKLLAQLERLQRRGKIKGVVIGHD